MLTYYLLAANFGKQPHNNRYHLPITVLKSYFYLHSTDTVAVTPFNKPVFF
uniref:Uncharacterized protein n=1 Tax=Ciona intestinalis TaxID=7719 RepID=H2XS54_CIOIN